MHAQVPSSPTERSIVYLCHDASAGAPPQVAFLIMFFLHGDLDAQTLPKFT